MLSVLLTQSTTPIIGQVAWVFGKIMDFLFSVVGIENIGLCIIIFTFIAYTLMIPLTIKQQKFSKLSAVMNPEIQAIQKKYKNKKDQASMAKQQEEMSLVYEKYGTSPTGGCAPMVIQLPVMFALYQVIRNIPAYVTGAKNVYMPLIEKIRDTGGFQKTMEKIGEAKPILINPEKFDYTKTNTLVDVLYKFQGETWDKLTKAFPDLSSTIETTSRSVAKMNNFLGINIAEAPLTLFMDAFKNKNFGGMILAVSIPILSGVTQWMSLKLTPQAPGGDSDNPMASSMKTMNTTMPIFSAVMCFTLPAGLGLYWVAGAVFRSVQQLVINKHMENVNVDDMIKKNREKANKKREKKGIPAQNINTMAQKSVRNIEEPKKLKNSTKKDTPTNNSDPKPGSLAAKASMVKKFNENDDK